MTELFLEFKPTKGCKSFLIKDVSNYNPDLPITCNQLLVKVPGFTYGHTFEPLSNFELLVNMSNVGISKHGPLPQLPDGNYDIKYSINPNDKLFVEYNYYSTCQLQEDYINAALNLYKSENPLSFKSIDKLFEISNLIEHAKLAAEDTNNIYIANDLYNQAKTKLKELENGCNVC